MSDTFDHLNDAFDSEWDNMEDGYPESYGRRLGFKRTEADALQPEFHQLEVRQVHAETERSYCVSGVVAFDTPYMGLTQFEFLADWIPKKCCDTTGTMARVPHWLVKARHLERVKRDKKFSGLLRNR